MTAQPESPHGAYDTGGSPLAVSYDKGVLIASEDGSFRTKIGIRGQFRIESARPLEEGSSFANRMALQRSRLYLEGNFLGEKNRYKLDYVLSDRGSFGFVKDFYVDRSLGPAYLRAGQWKRPFNRHEMISDFYTQFNEYSNVSDFLGGGRDLGIGLHNGYDKSPAGLEWVIGVFNGFTGATDKPVISTQCTDGGTALTCTTPTPTNVPADWGPGIVARIGWNSRDMRRDAQRPSGRGGQPASRPTAGRLAATRRAAADKPGAPRRRHRRALPGDRA